jgi:hypothetical protein
MEESNKLSQNQAELLINSIKKNNEIKAKINSFESELEWTESSNPNDYKYISHLEKIIDDLYEELESVENNA